MRKLSLIALLLSPAFAAPALAQDAPAPAAETPPADAKPAETAPAPAAKKHGGGPGLSLDPNVPQSGAILVSPVEVVAPPEENTSSEWKFEVTGYFRAPLRMSWGPANNPAPMGVDAGTQLRTPPLVPDANYIDWRYTNSLVGPWTELNFHYGNSRVKATVQIASYNLTDAGYRRLESNLGINQSFLSINLPELFDENSRFTLTVGGFTNRYGAAGRYDGGKYETYLFGRTHVAGETGTFEYDVADWTLFAEEGFGAKLEPIPFLAPPTNPSQNLAFNPFQGPVAQESTFVAHGHLGASFKKMVLIGLHYIDTFANDAERAGGYRASPPAFGGRDPSIVSSPHIIIYGADVKLLGGVLGDGYLGYAHLDAAQRGVPWRRHRDDPLLRRVAAARQLLRASGRVRGATVDGGDREDRHRRVSARLQLRPALSLPAGLLGRRSGSDRVDLRHVQQGVGRARPGVEPQPLQGRRRGDLPARWLGSASVGGTTWSIPTSTTPATTSRCSHRASSSAASSSPTSRSCFSTRATSTAPTATSRRFPTTVAGSLSVQRRAGQAVGADKNAFTMAAIIWF